MGTQEGYEEVRRHKSDTEISFLSKWSILSGGTFSLLVPLIQSLNDNILLPKILILGEIFLLVSLISSLIGLFSIRECVKRYIYSYSSPNPNDKLYLVYFYFKEWTPIVSLFSYIIGVILIVVFINFNLL